VAAPAERTPMSRTALLISMAAIAVGVAAGGCGANAGSAASLDADAAGSVDGAEAGGDASDGEACNLLVYTPQLVCFGAATSDYAKYLKSEAGVGVGQCPTVGAFQSSQGEGSCGYSVCGPLQPSAIPPEAGLDGGSSCCFWTISICGV
jgi:hypothetical protein